MSNASIAPIPLVNLAIAFIPVVAVIGLLFAWAVDGKRAIYAVVRMLAQLLLVGYVLAYIFGADHAGVILAVLMVMVCSSSWIALGTVKELRKTLYVKTLISILIGGVLSLVCVTQGVLRIEPWFAPQYMVPLAGMIFANAMNSVSLAAERLCAELKRDVAYEDARRIAFQAALIPMLNSLFAVGLVSIPGMMTGQILSGISPLVAARYQIMVMCMVFGSTGISAACFLVMARPAFSRYLSLEGSDA
jgi:putative ABC transport system permease protein